MANIGHIASFVAGGVLAAGAMLLLKSDTPEETVPVKVQETPTKDIPTMTDASPSHFHNEERLDTARTAASHIVDYKYDAYVAGFFRGNEVLENLIELLKESNVRYNLEEIEDSDKTLSEESAEIRAKSKFLIYIIDSGSKGVVSLMEVARIINTHRENLILVVEDLLYNEQANSDGEKIFVSSTGETLNMEEIRESQTGRAYLRKLAKQTECHCYDDAGLMLVDLIAKFE